MKHICSKMKHASLFTGIGGFDLAAQWMGWENVFQVEIDKFCTKVLEKNFPNIMRYGNIKEFDGTKYRGTIDIISGGFPCQPFSVTGKRKGKEDDRYLWPEMLRVIGEVRPTFIVCENVTGIIGMALDQVLTSLEDEMYHTETFIIPACAVNAPHQRNRIWIVAYTKSIKNQRRRQGRFYSESSGFSDERITTNTESKRLQDGGLQCWNETEFAKSYNDSPAYNWNSFPTQPPVCRRHDGISNRVDRIKSLGNAIVPQVAYEIFKAIETVNQKP